MNNKKNVFHIFLRLSLTGRNGDSHFILLLSTKALKVVLMTFAQKCWPIFGVLTIISRQCNFFLPNVLYMVGELMVGE